MTNPVRSWRLLVGLKERRLEREREAMRVKSAALNACRDELQSAQDQLSLASSQHAEARQRMIDKIGGTQTFKPAVVPQLRADVERCEQAMQRADAEVKAKHSRVVEAQETLRQAQALVTRIENQLQQARDRLKEVLAQAERESDDATDEDAEETAVARMRSGSSLADADSPTSMPC